MSIFKPLLRKNVLTLILLLIVYAWFFVSNIQKTQPEAEVLGTNSNISLFVQPDTGRGQILDAIENANKEVLVVVYILSDKDIISALKAANKRGLDVYVMLEDHPFGGGNLNDITKKEIETAGIKFKWSNPKYTLTHEKAIVVDGVKAFILNQNLTKSSFSKNREYDAIDTNFKEVSEIRKMFIADWNRKDYESQSQNLINSPDNSRARLFSLIKSAAKSLDLELEVITDDPMEDLLCEKSKSIKVRLILPAFYQISSNKDAVEKLEKCGAFIRLLSSPYVHAKLIVADSFKAYIGSVNLTAQSMDKNRELGIILVENSSVKTLINTFDLDWNKASIFN